MFKISKGLLVMLGLVGFQISGLLSQELILELKGGMEERYALSEVLSIKFESERMVLNGKDGGKDSWVIEEIERYYFEGTSYVAERVERMEVRLSPNPTSQGVRIEVEGGGIGALSIGIWDGNGRQIEEVYKGNHSGYTEAYWRGKEGGQLGSGVYYCRIRLGGSEVSKSIIVQ
jgi:hypothetical protein